MKNSGRHTLAAFALLTGALGSAPAFAGISADVQAGATFAPDLTFVKSVEKSGGALKACNKYASAAAASGGDGSYGRPFRRVQDLVNSLKAGEVGCILAGTYNESVRVTA